MTREQAGQLADRVVASLMGAFEEKNGRPADISPATAGTVIRLAVLSAITVIEETRRIETENAQRAAVPKGGPYR